jgi:PAS domain S-box-containing protein
VKEKWNVLPWTIAATALLFLTELVLFGRFGLHVTNLSHRSAESISFAMLFLSLLSSLCIVYLTASDYQAALKSHAETRLLLKHHIEAINAAAIVAFTDPAGKITHVNESFCRISGYDKQELIGKSHAIVSSGYHPREFFQEMWRTIARKEIWRGEICNRAKDGHLYWVQSTIVPISSPNGRISQYVAIRQDITEQKQRELTMVQSAKMASLGEMAGGIAHEINNPLTIIQGKASLLLKKSQNGGLSEAYTQEHLEKIVSTCERIAKIVNGLRTFSRSGEKDPFTPIKLQKIITDTEDLCAEKFKNHCVKLEIAPVSDTTISCRSVQLSQVLLNLLNNSFDAISPLEEKWIHIDTALLDTVVRITVTDSGNGIPAEVAAKIMQPFFTTKETGKGTGLGLSISRGIVEEHGGKLYLDQSSAHTKFILEIPRERAVSRTA